MNDDMKPCNKPIIIVRGDDTDAFGLRTITIKLSGDLNLRYARAKFALLNFTKEWTNEETSTGEITFSIPSEDTKQMPLGDAFGKLWLYEINTGATDKRLTVCNTIPFHITNKVLGLQSDEFEVNVTLAVNTELNIEFVTGGGSSSASAWATYPNGTALYPSDNNIQKIVIPALSNVQQLGDRYTLADVKNLVNTILNALKV